MLRATNFSKIRNIKGDTLTEAEFDEIYHKNFDSLFLFARNITKSDELPKDIVSEVFLNLWKNRSRFSEIREIESYLFISVKNQAIRLLSNDFNSTVTVEFENTVKRIDKIDPEQLLFEKELTDELERVISSLPEQCQLIFRMAKEDQLKYKEIARELGISLATVKSQLVKATSIVRETIRRMYHDPESDNSKKWQQA